jgi:hypothetical protein
MTSQAADIERSVQSEDSASMTARGMRLLSGSDGEFAPDAGAALLARAAELGSAEACARVAVLSGAGVCRAQDWQSALDWLQRAAELGWAPAREQLMFLSADHPLVERAKAALAAGWPGDWRALRESIDLRAWLTVPQKQILSESPRIRRYEEFIPRSLCHWLIESSRAKLRRAGTYNALTGMSEIGNARTNAETDFNIVESELPLLLVRARIAEATGLPTAIMELSKVLHYATGQQFGAHFDFIDPVTPALAAEVSERGQRMATFLIYLNDEYDGGETDFPQIGLRHRGRTGDALFFANVDTNGVPDPLTLHAGLAPTRGEKWLLSQWIRDQVQAGRE